MLRIRYRQNEKHRAAYDTRLQKRAQALTVVSRVSCGVDVG
jgi:hypothetical protein